jgi:DNA end-binding protein Ku
MSYFEQPYYMTPDNSDDKVYALLRETLMEGTLVEGMTEEWAATRYRDTYREDLLAMVQKKIKTNQAKTITQPDDGGLQPRTAKIIDLMALLKQSVNWKNGKAVAGGGVNKALRARKSAKSKSASAAKSAVKTAAGSARRKIVQASSVKGGNKAAATLRAQA